MRRILNAALVLGGIFVGVMASLSTSPAKMDATENHLIVHGLYVALPSDMRKRRCLPTARERTSC
jgi:hypothetical protein